MNNCLEVKYFLKGGKRTYSCELIEYNGKFGILKYILPWEYRIEEVVLPKGTITFAFYWVDRPYTIYSWYDNKYNCVANYFNIADSVELTKRVFTWRDLVIDILVLPNPELKILDENELPNDTEPEIMYYIQSAKSLVINDYKLILKEINDIIKNKILK